MKHLFFALIAALSINSYATLQKIDGKLIQDQIQFAPMVGFSESHNQFIPTLVNSDGSIIQTPTDSPLQLISTQRKINGGLMINTGDGLWLRGMPLAGLTSGGIFVPVAVDGAGKFLTSTSGTMTSVTAGVGLLGGTITGSGTIDADVGVSANKLVQLNGDAKLPAVDGSNLTLVDAASLFHIDLSDAGPTDGQTISYNTGTNKWEPTDFPPGTGTVTSVASGVGLLGGPITGAGTLDVDVGNGPNQIVQLDASSRIPLIDGSLLTNITAVQLQGRDIDSAAPADSDVLTWNNSDSKWEPRANVAGSMLGGNNVSFSPPNDLDVLTWNAGSSEWEPQPTGAVSGANSSLSNLTTTDINQNLIMDTGTHGVIQQKDGTGSNLTIKTGSVTGSTNNGTLILQGGSSVNGSASDVLITGGSASGSGVRGDVAIQNHIRWTGSGAAIGSCGSSPSLNGGDMNGTITVGTGGVATSCAITFHQAYYGNPNCVVSSDTDIAAFKVVTSTTTMTISAVVAFTASSKLSYICMGH